LCSFGPCRLGWPVWHGWLDVGLFSPLNLINCLCPKMLPDTGPVPAFCLLIREGTKTNRSHRNFVSYEWDGSVKRGSQQRIVHRRTHVYLWDPVHSHRWLLLVDSSGVILHPSLMWTRLVLLLPSQNTCNSIAACWAIVSTIGGVLYAFELSFNRRWLLHHHPSLLILSDAILLFFRDCYFR